MYVHSCVSYLRYWRIILGESVLRVLVSSVMFFMELMWKELNFKVSVWKETQVAMTLVPVLPELVIPILKIILSVYIKKSKVFIMIF